MDEVTGVSVGDVAMMMMMSVVVCVCDPAAGPRFFRGRCGRGVHVADRASHLHHRCGLIRITVRHTALVAETHVHLQALSIEMHKDVLEAHSHHVAIVTASRCTAVLSVRPQLPHRRLRRTHLPIDGVETAGQGQEEDGQTSHHRTRQTAEGYANLWTQRFVRGRLRT
jgi:hypothetical protein